MMQFVEAYEKHVWDVYGFFAYRLGSRLDAEDLTQLTFERALRAWGRFDPGRASVRTWLLAIARNLLIDHYRSGSGPALESLEERDAGDEPTVGGADAEAQLGLSPELSDALATLDDRARELIALSFGAELSGPEIAALTGLSVANVQQILSRSLRALRRRLEEVSPRADRLPPR
jgi:RNA polymerase sigma factor (sigma-70 family)